MEKNPSKQGQPEKPEMREQWVELRTETERIEGIVHMPAGAKGRRIADFLSVADRGQSGMLHLSQVTVFDSETNEIKFRKRNLAVNKAKVIYAAPLSSNEILPKRVWEPPKVGVSTN